jgi:hypothetical protein
MKNWIACCDIASELAWRHSAALEEIKASGLTSASDFEMMSYRLSGVPALESLDFNPMANDVNFGKQVEKIIDALKRPKVVKCAMSINLWRRKRKGGADDAKEQVATSGLNGSEIARGALQSSPPYNSLGAGGDSNGRLADCSTNLLSAAWGQELQLGRGTPGGWQVGADATHTVLGIQVRKLKLSNKFRVGTYRVSHRPGIRVRTHLALSSTAVGKLQLHDTFDVFEVGEVDHKGKKIIRLKLQTGWTSMTNAKDFTNLAVQHSINSPSTSIHRMHLAELRSINSPLTFIN